jgi:hypothetical protein
MNKLIRKDGLVWLGVPFLTQLDGTAYGPVNCGPASTAMVLGTFGIRVSPAAVRDYVNSMSGVYNLAAGTSLEHLGRLVRESGLEVSNLYGPGGGFRRWSVDLLRQEVQAGHPVVTLVKYRALPSHAASVTEFDHYIVIAGLAGDDFIYNDAVYTNSSVGYGLVISPRDLERAWDYSSIPRHGMAVGLGAGRLAQQAAPEGEAPEGETEMAEGDVLADDVMLGAALEQRLNVDALSLKRVMIDGLTDAEYLIEPSFELAEFIDPAKVKLAGGEQAAPPVLQPVAAPDPRPSLPLLALVPTALGLFAVALIVRYRRALG